MNHALLAPSHQLGTAPAATKADEPLIVTFQIGHQQYGLPLAVVLEIVRLPALVTLAGAPATLCGLLNLRGRYLPVLDGRTLVGEPPLYDVSCQIVIAGREKPELGLLVDRVRDVRATVASRITEINQNHVAAFLTNVFESEDGSVLLFDLAALLALTSSKTKVKAKSGSKNRSRDYETSG
jgi:purine-binding chemotaxis protein CheW